MTEAYDLVVVGAGSAGITTARTAAGLGGRVLLVERARTGGDCLWTGCVPSKALLAAAAAAHAVRTAGRFGVHADEPTVDFADVMAHVRGAQAHIEPVDSPASLRAAGIEVRIGAARFTAPDTLTVDGDPVRFRAAVVASGSEPVVPRIDGLTGAGVVSSDTVWELAALPERLVVLGGGPIGCELGQAFVRLGSRVTIVESLDRLLTKEEPASSRVVTAALAAEGVDVRTGHTAVRYADGALVVRDGAGAEHAVPADVVLVSVGRRPRTAGLGLAAAGVELGERGHVQVDAKLRTSNPRILSACDVTGAPPFTHVAGAHGGVAAFNALLGPVRAARSEGLPWVTFTDPEVARVGLTVAEAGERYGRAVVRRVPAGHIDRAVADGRTEGFTLLVGDRKGRLVGATVVSPHAGETIAELAAVIRHGGSMSGIAGTVHPYPSYGDGIWTAATIQFRTQLRAPLTRRAIALARGVRGRWFARGSTPRRYAGPVTHRPP
ncbi:MAG: dihydrolipoyl dehydrogenase family protein [Pseudonocardiaceae bacterium]